MNLSNRDKGLLLGLAGLLIAAVVYFLIFTPFVQKAEEKKAELTVLQEREAQLMEMEANMDFYNDEITRLSREKEAYLVQFPSTIKEESEIMYAVELEENVEIEFSALNYGTAMPVAADGTAAPAEGEAAEQTEETQAAEQAAEGQVAEGQVGRTEPVDSTEGELSAYCIPMVMTYQSSYKGLKESITYTNAYNNRMVIDALTATFDATTGKITGNMTLNMYLITGTGKLYEEPYVPAMKFGVSNIFGKTK